MGYFILGASFKARWAPNDRICFLEALMRTPFGTVILISYAFRRV